MAHRSVIVNLAADVTPYIARVAEAQLEGHLIGCPVCAHYVKRRGATLSVAADRHRVSAPLLLVRYVVGSVHQRHLAGESLSTRPYTPDRDLGGGKRRLHVKRCCNGCGKELGDAHDDELTGGPLPDVRLECGCWAEDQAA